MRQETLGLSRFRQFVLMGVVGEVAVAGLVAGIVFAALHPPLLTSTALVALQEPASVQQSGNNTTTGVTDTFTATQEIVAGSYPVLSDALPNVRPAMSFDELRHNVQVGSPSSAIISINAKGKNAADAEATANAVAYSYIHYVSSPHSAVGRVQAQLLESASIAATGRPLPASLLITGGFGALYGSIVGAIVALAFGWTDRRFRISR
jgi:capsular polysaccharide biosynthesis protein